MSSLTLLEQLQPDRSAAVPLTRQLAAGLRSLSASGQLPAGAQLPPTRQLAAALGISRGTVTEVFETLCAEGYLEAQVGAGTFVRALPAAGRDRGRPSARAQALAQLPVLASPSTQGGPPRPLRHSQPDARLFPWKTWARLEAQASWAPARRSSAAGWPPLREQVAAYLRRERGLDCQPEQVIITTGSQQALDLAARTLLDQEEQVALESPGYPGTRAAMLGAGLRPLALPVDEAGLDPAALWRQPRLRMVGVTPAHQFPTGVSLSPGRRLELLRWAEEQGGWILEDDYDSEYRYAGPPLTPLQALSDRVIHLGTFSAFLFSGLRLGFLVVPLHLAGTFTAVKQAMDGGSSLHDSATLARFMAEGHFTRHLARTRRIYAARHDFLLAQVQALGATVPAPGRGLHLTAYWPSRQQAQVLRQAPGLGLDLTPVQAFQWGRQTNVPGLLLGFAASTPGELQEALGRLALALSSAR
ncbi:PLP-dependent aminotransferase family protein [Deinococcus sp. Marseille-Q6407]|uniref:MocR-like pyridoxine biosynthesis transcription factor PdxR n=1 Tax=Deinococcus sp. Marseille-Q6407 TaxID=2969223 RepID=UPI0021C042C5|nr:PLP-dependent aminotransferase family protein [Deinococcus sp. Marseille-Q6407]